MCIGLTQSPLKTSAVLMFLLFHTRQCPKALASLVSYQPLSVYNSKLLTQPMIHSFHFVLLSAFPRNKKARTVRAGFVTPSGFKPETF
jgi:hypothetical protein